MAAVSDLFRAFWRSGEYVGSQRPQCSVRIRRGYFDHHYAAWTGDAELDVTVLGVPPNHHSGQWQSTWTPIDDWRDVPMIDEVDLTQDFTQNGLTTATITVTNVDMEEQTGPFGAFHRIVRGFLSPWYGASSKWSPRPRTGMQANEWIGYLNQPAQVEITQGYGTETAKVFTGLIEQLDLKSLPDQVTMTLRDFGQVFDESLIGHVKDPRLLGSDVVFVDRLSNENAHEVGAAGPHDCSSADPAHPARYATDDNRRTAWASQLRDTPDATEWVQLRVPNGRYDGVRVEPAYAGMGCYVSVYAHGRNAHTSSGRCEIDGVAIDDGWIDLGGGEVPGSNGGIPSVRHYGSLPAEMRNLPFGHSIALGDDSIIRVSFRPLRKVMDHGGRRWRAGVRRLIAIRRRPKKIVTENLLILVDDVSDMVKLMLVWAGFKEWNVESSGARIPTDTNLTFTHGNTMLDVIKKAQEITNFVFFMDDPTAADLSIGVPTFRSPRLLPPPGVESEAVTETDLLAGAEVKWDKTPLAEYFIARGKSVSKGGEMLDTERMLRLNGRYTPIWTRNAKVAGLRRYTIHTYEYLTKQQEVEVAARMLALNGALQSLTAILEVPGHPGISLDSVIGAIDSGSGLNTRMYVAARSSQFTAGVQAKWLTTLGGSLLDEPYIQTTIQELNQWINPGELEDAEPARDPNVPTVISGYPQPRSRGPVLRPQRYR